MYTLFSYCACVCVCVCVYMCDNVCSVHTYSEIIEALLVMKLFLGNNYDLALNIAIMVYLLMNIDLSFHNTDQYKVISVNINYVIKSCSTNMQRNNTDIIIMNYVSACMWINS